MAITQWILGIRPEYDGLRVDPVLPDSWPGFTLTRHFRGTTYNVVVSRAASTGRQVRDLIVDGRLLVGTLVPPAPEGATLTVEAVLR